MANSTKGSDAANTGFAIRENIAKHKHGYELGEQVKETAPADNHRFKRSDAKAVPQTSLAERIAKIAKGG